MDDKQSDGLIYGVVKLIITAINIPVDYKYVKQLLLLLSLYTWSQTFICCKATPAIICCHIVALMVTWTSILSEHFHMHIYPFHFMHCYMTHLVPCRNGEAMHMKVLVRVGQVVSGTTLLACVTEHLLLFLLMPLQVL